MEVILSIAVAGIIMGILDFVWLGFIAKKLYYSELKGMLLEKPNMSAALLFYAVYVIGTVVFVIMPAIASESVVTAFGMGALFGFVAYATYDLTNLATLKNFSKKVVVIDLVWGAFLTAVVSGGTVLAVQLVV